jgi:hypothetical protein
MLVLPAVQLHAMDAPPGARAQRWVVFGIVWCALLLSITRMTIMACAIQAILLLLLTRRTMAVGTLATMGAGLALAAVAASGDVRDFVWRTLSFDTQSSVSHIADWTDGVEAMWDYPVGAGLATADLTAARFDRGPLSADNLLFKYGVELGWPGLLVFVLFFVALLAAGMRLSRRAGGPTRSGALFTIAVTTAILINGATSVVTNLPFLAYVWAWIAGATVARERQIPHHSVTA